MKGRARKLAAKFFVFEDCLEQSKARALRLEVAQKMERRVQDFVESKAARDTFTENSNEVDAADESSEPEVAALRDGSFKIAHGVVDLQSAKSLLTRYCLSVPIDPSVRFSKESLLVHLPEFWENALVLPSHLPSRFRTVTLPSEYRDHPKRAKQKMLSLMACVRLHSHGLLNGRLLPLTRADLRHKLLGGAAAEGSKVEKLPLPLERFYGRFGSKQIFVYPIYYQGMAYKRLEQCVKGEGHMLGFVTLEPIKTGIPTFGVPHKDFGVVTISLSHCIEMNCSPEQFNILEKTFLLCMNERWSRRSRNIFFEIRNQNKYESAFMPYLVGLLSRDGDLDWKFMSNILTESKRTDDERKQAVEELPCDEALTRPRVWTTISEDQTRYLAFGPADELAYADFPAEKKDVTTYKDYFEKYRGINVPAEDVLFDVQRYWSQPSKFDSMKADTISPDHPVKNTCSKFEMCPELSSVKVPQSACLEASLANAHVSLLLCFLPQFLFVYERHQTVEALVAFCKINLPVLGSCLEQLPHETVATALTAKSCGMDVSYEKLEWLGDAALKMIQTESLLKSIELRNWIRSLHEGDLSLLRQGEKRFGANLDRH